MNMLFPPLWRLIDVFKGCCQVKGWETCEIEDWIKTEDGKYHNILWTKTIHPSTFKSINNKSRCGIRHDKTYDVVKVAYIAWLFQEKPPEILMLWIKEDSDLAKKSAIFDLSSIYKGDNICFSYNQTESIVFKELEKFMKEKWQIDFKPFSRISAITNQIF